MPRAGHPLGAKAHPQGLSRRRRQRRRLASASRRRDPRPPRREWQRQDHAHQDLCGAHQPDAGSILRDGRPVVIASPMHARELGVATVFQEFSLVPTLTVAENIHLGRWPGSRAWLDWRRMRDEAHRAFAAMEIEIDPDAIVGELSIPQQQLVEIAKAIALEASMIILDEPTAALGLAEIARLHALLRRLRAQGQSVLYVSHRLDEVTALVDVATVLRNGRVVSPAETTRSRSARSSPRWWGRGQAEHYPRSATPLPSSCLRSRGSPRRTACARPRLRCIAARCSVSVAFWARAGPRSRGRCLASTGSRRAGSPGRSGAARTWAEGHDPSRFALLTEDRKADGLFVNFDTPRNITIANLASIVRGGRLDLAAEQAQP